MIRLILCLIALAAGPAAAHFSEGTKPRTIVLATGEEGLVAHLRVPAPLMFADRVVEAMEAQKPFAAPFVRAERGSNALRHRLDIAAIERDAERFEARLADALPITRRSDTGAPRPSSPPCATIGCRAPGDRPG